MKFCTTKFFAAIWFFALFLNAFSIVLFAATPNIPAEKVYCPLTGKLQPVKASKKEVRKNPLDEICADDREKELFANEFFRQNLLKMNFSEENKFENLVFDFFQKGSAAFANLPSFPDSPHKDSFKGFSAAAAFGKKEKTQFVWKTQTGKFSFAQNPRPPNAVSANLYKPQVFSKLEKISRRTAPRAPPFSL